MLLYTCPYHAVKLQQYCPKCHGQTVYELSRNAPRNGVFSCRCGYVFLASTSREKCWDKINALKLNNKEIERLA